MMTEALRVISSEHRSMWRLMEALEVLRLDIERNGERPDTDLFGLIFDFMESYIERVHQPKEEFYLYRVLRERAQVSFPLLDELEKEHEASPRMLAELRQALLRHARDYPQGREEFSRQLGQYIRLVQEHIKKEEKGVVTVARRMLKPEDWEEINKAFSDHTNPLFGDHAQAEFRALWTRIVNLAPDPIGLGLEHEHKQEMHPSAGVEALLRVDALASHYGRIQALKEVRLQIMPGQLVALVGANGAGKTTLLRAISGVQRISGGTLLFEGRDITRLRADKRVQLGICQVPEGRQVFGPLAVEDNLRLGAYLRPKAEVAEALERMYLMFPILKQKARQAAGTLSGGQQQMLAIARALMGKPKLLLLDEPSMGLAPLLVEEIFNAIVDLRKQGMTIFLVEQNAYAALNVADYAYVIETGATVLEGPGQDLLKNDQVRRAYLGM